MSRIRPLIHLILRSGTSRRSLGFDALHAFLVEQSPLQRGFLAQRYGLFAEQHLPEKTKSKLHQFGVVAKNALQF